MLAVAFPLLIEPLLFRCVYHRSRKTPAGKSVGRIRSWRKDRSRLPEHRIKILAKHRKTLQKMPNNDFY